MVGEKWKSRKFNSAFNMGGNLQLEKSSNHYYIKRLIVERSFSLDGIRRLGFGLFYLLPNLYNPDD